MFFDLIRRNSKKNRKENALFFSSLILSIIAFYIILSLSEQDVMRFLKKMESDAVNKLLLMIPVFYVMTLGILFFLIYFACKYQMQRRRHEFGMYFILGMERRKLFSMLLAEDLLSSLLALGIGLPAAVFLSELISLITAKLVGMGIIGHRFTLSVPAIAFTILGFGMIKLTAFLLLSTKICRQQIGDLLGDAPGGLKRQMPKGVYLLSFVIGVMMLAAAYSMAICGIAWQKMSSMFLTEMLGFFGTIFFFYGIRILIHHFAKAAKGKLQVFHFRQIEENIIQQSTTMAISSLLVLAALCCFGAGIGIAGSNAQKSSHVLDYTFSSYEDLPSEEVFPKIQKILKENHIEEYFAALFPMRLGNIRTTEEYENVFQMKPVLDALKQMPESQDRDILLNNLSYAEKPYVISLSDYNQLLELAEKPTVYLEEEEAAVYISPDMTNEERTGLLNQALTGRPQVELDGRSLYLKGEVQSVNLVTDRSITLSFALILPDEAFLYYTQEQYSVYVNGVLKEEAVEEAGLMQAISSLNHKLEESGLFREKIVYESYLQNMGRQLFYTVAAGYITIYLAIIFLIVANTILGVQFLMSQQKMGRRYQILVHLGADYKTICSSAGIQIRWFMGLPVAIAACSSLFGVRALFQGLLSSMVQGTQKQMLVAAAAMILLLVVVECIYMMAVKRSSDRFLLTLMQPKREE